MVGPQEVAFDLHSPILASQSPFFRVALNPSGSFSENATRTVKLPEESAKAFNHIITWLYGGSAASVNHWNAECKDYDLGLEVANLADMLGINPFKKWLVDWIMKQLEKEPAPMVARTTSRSTETIKSVKRKPGIS